MNVLISEFSAWHDECLYTTCLLLKAEGHRITVALNEDLKNRIGNSLDHVTDEVIYFPFKKGIKGGLAIIRLWNLLRSGRFSHFYLNSAQGSVAWKFFMLPIPSHIKVVGTIHNIKKLTSSLGQKLITRRINGYVLLSDLLTKRYQEVCNKPSAAIYPVYYPTFKTYKLPKKEGEIWIVIPGALSLGRRDYLTLLPPGQHPYAQSIKFILLGNKNKADGKYIHEEVEKAGIQSHFLFFDGFVPEEEFYSYIEQCDYIMPLIHPGRGEYDKYVTEKISGTYNLATAYRKIMLCSQEMEIYEDFRDSSLFYPLSNLPSFINSLKPIDNKDFYKLPKWEQKEQQKRLMDFLTKI